MSDRSPVFRIALLATGGTIEKRYDAHAGSLTLEQPVIDELLADLVHPDIAIRVVRVMALDSLDMGEAERAELVAVAQEVIAAGDVDGIVVTHGTDTLDRSATALAAALAPSTLPVVLTGAMRPYRVAESDAAQNVAQAIMAVQLAAPGVYGLMHGRLIAAAHIAKDYERLTFIDTSG